MSLSPLFSRTAFRRRSPAMFAVLWTRLIWTHLIPTGLWLALAALAPVSASPVSASPLSTPLDFNEALRIAEAAAPEIHAREAAVEAASQRVQPAGERPDPELIVGVENVPLTGHDAWNWNRDDMTMRRIGVMQALPGRGKRNLRQRRAEADADQERALLQASRLNTRESVATAWIDAHHAELRLMWVSRMRIQANALAEAANAAISSAVVEREGASRVTDAIAAEQARIALEERIAVLQGERDQARIQLARWLPDDAERPFGVAPDWRQLTTRPWLEPERIRSHRDVHALGAKLDAAELDIALARSEKRPDWSVELAYGDGGPGFANRISLEFRVGLPVFTERRQDAQIAAQESTLRQLESERDAVIREQLASLRTEASIWRQSVDRADRYEQHLLPMGEKRVAAALAAYRGGLGTLGDVLDAMDAAIEQQVAYIDVLNTLGHAWAALTFAFPEAR